MTRRSLPSWDDGILLYLCAGANKSSHENPSSGDMLLVFPGLALSISVLAAAHIQNGGSVIP
jgi:hypothetical protein